VDRQEPADAVIDRGCGRVTRRAARRGLPQRVGAVSSLARCGKDRLTRNPCFIR
jgi:hypothetical protein